jgi:hypothetical protein
MRKLIDRLKSLLGAVGKRTEPVVRRVRDLIGTRDFSTRDVRAIKIGVAVLAIFLVFSVYRAVFPGGSAVRSEVSQMRLQLNEMRAIKDEYRYSRDLLAKVSGSMKEEKEALISVAEKVLIRNGIDRRSFSIRGTNPSVRGKGIKRERAVLVKINKVSVPRVMNVLYVFQKSKTILKVSDLRIKTRFDNPNLTDVSFRLSTFSFSESG